MSKESLCDANIQIQILGSGGPELSDNRASSSYLVWINNQASILIDTGGGTALRFGQSKALWSNLHAVLFTHFHADHSSDFPALLKASWFGNRTTDLPIIGPYGNHTMPSTLEFISALYDKNNGAFKYLSDMVDTEQKSAYKIVARNLKDNEETQLIYQKDNMIVYAHQVKHGPIPAFAYIIKSCGKTIVFSGDTNGSGFETLKLARTNMFIAHNAIPENAGNTAKSLHMTPSQINHIAKHLNTKSLILSHRMNRTLGNESETLKFIKNQHFDKIVFANDLDIFTVN
jgi:ribonuclease BN (tRNA processing enzyme)